MDLESALAIVDRAADAAGKQEGVDEEALTALRWLWRHFPKIREDVVTFKERLEWHEPIGRSQSANAGRNRIRWLLGVPRSR